MRSPLSQLVELSPLPAAPLVPARTGERGSLQQLGRDCLTLAKPRITLMVLVATAAGYLLAAPHGAAWRPLLDTLWGTALAAAGAGVLNQVLERALDARMARTRSRPLAAGRMRPGPALLAGLSLSLLGVGWLAVRVNALTALLAFLTLATYLALYTPLKRRTSLATLVGAVPGALPPLAGAAAASGRITLEGLLLFGILFLWQIPHFLAVGWLYRADYRRAGFPLLASLDPSGAMTARQVLGYGLALGVLSLQPVSLGLAGNAYLAAAVVLGAGLLACAGLFARRRSRRRARLLFRASVLYLPLLLAALVLDGSPL